MVRRRTRSRTTCRTPSPPTPTPTRTTATTHVAQRSPKSSPHTLSLLLLLLATTLSLTAIPAHASSPWRRKPKVAPKPIPHPHADTCHESQACLLERRHDCIQCLSGPDRRNCMEYTRLLYKLQPRDRTSRHPLGRSRKARELLKNRRAKRIINALRDARPSVESPYCAGFVNLYFSPNAELDVGDNATVSSEGAGSLLEGVLEESFPDVEVIVESSVTYENVSIVDLPDGYPVPSPDATGGRSTDVEGGGGGGGIPGVPQIPSPFPSPSPSGMPSSSPYVEPMPATATATVAPLPDETGDENQDENENDKYAGLDYATARRLGGSVRLPVSSKQTLVHNGKIRRNALLKALRQLTQTDHWANVFQRNPKKFRVKKKGKNTFIVIIKFSETFLKEALVLD